jgi:predicted nucleic acid-binding protein
MILLDTNILIEILKGNPKTTQQLELLGGPLAISSITAMELIYGARNRAEVRQLEKFMLLFQSLHLSSPISTRALKLITSYAKSHTLDIPDALIAATSLEHQVRLFTYNQKDFRFIPDLELV